MEKAHKVLMVELNCEWLDVGSWTALEDEVYGLMQAASIDWGRVSATDSKSED